MLSEMLHVEKMLLESEHNDLARAAELHLKRKYNCKLVYGASRESNSSSLQSVMTCIDNVPDDYPFKFVTRALLHKLVTDWKSMSRVLKRHLDKSKHSYQKLVLDLSKDEKMNAATDFYVAGLRVLYDIPILLVQPHKITHPSGETDYVFKEEYCIDGDEILNPSDFRIRLLFNGLNHYTLFYPAEIADIINDGHPASKKYHQDLLSSERHSSKDSKKQFALQYYEPNVQAEPFCSIPCTKL